MLLLVVLASALRVRHAPSARCAPPVCSALAPPQPAASVGSSEEWAAAMRDGGAAGVEEGAAYYEAFRALAASSEFAREEFARRPKLIEHVPGVAGSFTLDHLAVAVDSDFLDAGRGIPDKGGWKMAPVSQPRGASFEDAKMRYVDVVEALKAGTVVFNSAGAHIPRLGTLCVAALDAFELPNCLNLYCTARGMRTSAPPHTDKQDVFVLQSCGAKRWRVFEPPPPDARPQADPLARGKAHDELKLEELGEPVIDTVLTPGQVLFVPAGWPHTTDTVNTATAADAAAAEDDSVHLTIGIDTHIWRLNYASMRRGALARAGLPDKLNECALPAADYWKLMGVPASLGFLRRSAGGDTAEDAADAASAAGAADATDATDAASSKDAAVVAELVACLRAAEPERWADASAEDISKRLGLSEVAAQLQCHATRMVEVQRAMYLDAARDVRPTAQPGMPRISLFRVREHMARLEAAMDEHLQWYGPEAVARATAAAAAASKAAANAAAKAKGGGVGGFGGAASGAARGAMGGGAKKGAAKKKKAKKR